VFSFCSCINTSMVSCSRDAADMLIRSYVRDIKKINSKFSELIQWHFAI
jgi:hypothetical protein